LAVVVVALVVVVARLVVVARAVVGGAVDAVVVVSSVVGGLSARVPEHAAMATRPAAMSQTVRRLVRFVAVRVEVIVLSAG
jgi:hypothetical protein